MNTDLDFWVGTWQVADPSDGTIGTNRVRRILGGAVIEEDFRFPGPDGEYRGRSHTVHVDGRGWCQTWVDSSGLYLDFVGGPTADGVVLERVAVVSGTAVTQRMKWCDIQSDALVWKWLRAPLGTDDWTLLWQLDYTRTA